MPNIKKFMYPSLLFKLQIFMSSSHPRRSRNRNKKLSKRVKFRSPDSFSEAMGYWVHVTTYIYIGVRQPLLILVYIECLVLYTCGRRVILILCKINRISSLDILLQRYLSQISGFHLC